MKIEITPELLVDLKEKAEKALKDDVVAFIPTDDSYKNQALYVNAANPAVMLALIAKIEQLEKEADLLAEKADKTGGCLDRKCPQKDKLPEARIYKEKCIACWRKSAKEAIKANE